MLELAFLVLRAFSLHFFSSSSSIGTLSLSLSINALSKFLSVKYFSFATLLLKLVNAWMASSINLFSSLSYLSYSYFAIWMISFYIFRCFTFSSCSLSFYNIASFLLVSYLLSYSAAFLRSSCFNLLSSCFNLNSSSFSFYTDSKFYSACFSFFKVYTCLRLISYSSASWFDFSLASSWSYLFYCCFFSFSTLSVNFF